MKKLLITALILNLILPVSAISLDDVAMPKQPAYRTGLSEEPEKELIYTEIYIRNEYTIPE